jgi:hypothetical protein
LIEQATTGLCAGGFLPKNVYFSITNLIISFINLYSLKNIAKTNLFPASLRTSGNRNKIARPRFQEYNFPGIPKQPVSCVTFSCFA